MGMGAKMGWALILKYSDRSTKVLLFLILIGLIYLPEPDQEQTEENVLLILDDIHD